MHHPLRVLVLAASALLFSPATLATDAQTTYRVTVLSDAGAAGRSVNDINDRGEITGRMATGQAFLATPVRNRH